MGIATFDEKPPRSEVEMFDEKPPLPEVELCASIGYMVGTESCLILDVLNLLKKRKYSI